MVRKRYEETSMEPSETLKLEKAHGPSREVEPYRVFFPQGIFFGLLGVGVWGAYDMGWIQTIPSWWHIDLQIQGFLSAFVFGFLFTAVPRFTMAQPMGRRLLQIGSCLLLAANLFTVFGFKALGRYTYVGFFAFSLGFIVSRFLKRKQAPPEEFGLVGLGLLMGLIATLCRAASLSFFLEGETLGNRLFTEGMMVLLVLGVGGKLFPLFFGLIQGNMDPSQALKKRTWTSRHLSVVALGIAYASTFYLEYKLKVLSVFWIRAIVATVIAFNLSQIYRWPKTGGVLVRFLWVSAWAVLLSLWGTALHPEYRLPVLHVMFIAGFGLMILCIATRVTLGHGGYDKSLEKRSKSLAFGGVLLILAVLARSLAPLFPERYFAFLSLASWTWVVGLILWGAVFVPKQVKFRSE